MVRREKSGVKYSNTATHSSVTESNDGELQEDDERDDHQEPVGSLDVFEDVKLVLDFPRVDEVVDLEEDEEVENDSHVSRRTINLDKR